MIGADIEFIHNRIAAQATDERTSPGPTTRTAPHPNGGCPPFRAGLSLRDRMAYTSKREKRPKSAEGEKPQREYRGDWKPAFLAYLRRHPNVSRAAREAGVSRKMAYKAREQSGKFAEEWDEAYDEAIAEIERVAFENASSGSAQYQTMMIFLLKNWMPERYKDVVQNEHTGKDGGDVVVKVLRGVSVDDL